MTVRVAYSLWLGLVLGLLAGCGPVPITPVIPPMTAQVEFSEVQALERGTPRETVVAALGAPNRVLATDRFEVYAIERIEGYQVYFPVIALAPAPVAEDQTLHFLVHYDARGRVEQAAWELGAVGKRILGEARSEVLPLDRGGDVVPGTATAERLAGWQGRRVHLSPDGRRALVVQLSGADTIIAIRRPVAAQLWDLDARAPLGPQVRPPHRLDGPLTLFDDGHVAGHCDPGQVCLWDARTGEVRWSFAAPGTGGFWDPPGSPLGLEAAPDGTRLAVTDLQPVLRLVDRNGATLSSRRLEGLSLPAWAGDRAIVAETLPSGRVRFSEVADGRTLLETAHHLRGSLKGFAEASGFFAPAMIRSGAATAMPADGLYAVSPDGLRLALNRQTHVEVYARADQTATFRLWRVYLLPVFVDIADLFPLGTIGFAADGRRLAAGYGTLSVWDLDEDRELLRLVPSRPAGMPVPAGEIDLVHGFRFLPDGRRFVTANGLYAIDEPSAPRQSRSSP